MQRGSAAFHHAVRRELRRGPRRDSVGDSVADTALDAPRDSAGRLRRVPEVRVLDAERLGTRVALRSVPRQMLNAPAPR